MKSYLVALCVAAVLPFTSALTEQTTSNAEYDEAYKKWQNDTEIAIKKLPEYEQLFVKALQEAQSGKWEKALENAEASLKVNASQPGVYFLESQIHLVENKNDLALSAIQKAAELAPDNKLILAQVQFHKGLKEQSEKNFAAANKLFKKSVALMEGESDPKSLEKAAIAVAALGDVSGALAIAKQLWKEAPFYAFHNNIPFVRMADKYDEMIEHARAKGPAYADAIAHDLSNITTVTDKVWFEFEYEGVTRKVTIGLYGLAAPRAVHNMVTMFTCSLGESYCYKGSKFHRIIKDFIVQGGDVFPGDGTGRTNIYDRPYGDEPFALGLMHDGAGVVQMANSGPDSNGGQFVIMVAAAAHLNGGHVVVGKVIEGLEHVVAVNAAEVDSSTYKPKKDVVISKCGAAEM